MSDIKKVPLLLWSGGLDSTFAAWQMAHSGQDFDYVYIDGGQGARKLEAEREALTQLSIALAGMYPDVKIGQASSPFSRFTLGNSPDAKFRQCLPWLVSAMEVVDPTLHDTVVLSYVSGDQINPHLTDIYYAWQYMWAFSKTSDMVPVKFPLQYISKVDILTKLPKDLIKLTWSCEKPLHGVDHSLTQCGECIPCVRQKVTQYEYSLLYPSHQEDVPCQEQKLETVVT